MPSFQFASTKRELEQVDKLVVNFLKDLSVSPQLEGKILIASLEALTNAINHGNKNDNQKVINFVLEKQNDFIKIVVEDEGIGFDYNKLPDPTSEENILKLEGRGVFLMKKLSDKLLYNDKGNRVELYFKL